MVTEGVTRPAVRRRGAEIHAVVAGFCLAVVLIGFVPTLYLRGLFDTPPVPLRVHVHGWVLTAWFVLAMAQPLLIRRRNVQLHRRLGFLGAGLAVAVFLSSVQTMLGYVPRLAAEGYDWESKLDHLTAVVWGNGVMAAAFAMFIVLGLRARRDREGSDQGSHQHFMTLASIALISPAVARIARTPLQGLIPEPFLAMAVIGGLLGLLALGDLWAGRRLHPVTFWGGGGFFAALVLTGLFVIPSGLAQDFLRWLAGP